MSLNFTRSLVKGKSLLDVVKVTTAKYHEKVIDHYENPRNVGSLDKKDDTVGTGLVGAPACGDVMKLQVLYNFCTKNFNKKLNKYF